MSRNDRDPDEGCRSDERNGMDSGGCAVCSREHTRLRMWKEWSLGLMFLW